jgi:hypothetical protein
VRRVWRWVRPARIRLAWLTLGYLAAVGMAFFGSKLLGLWEEFVTWQGASREQRAQWRRTRRLDDHRFDWMGTEQ